MDIYRLTHAPVKKEEGYELNSEPAGIYRKEIGFDPEREWDNELAIDTADPPTTESNISPEKVKLCQQVHDLQVQVLEGFGIDACRHYQQNKVEHILEAVQATDDQCPLCHKHLARAAAVRTHIRGKHMDVTPFKCQKCD